MNDQQFDRLIRASLSWQADRAVATQPMRLAVRRLAVRLGSQPPVTRPHVVMLPVPAGMFNLVLLALMLLLLIGGAVLVGSLLLRDSAPRPGPFGFASECDLGSLRGEASMLFSAGGPTTYLYSDGRLLTDVSHPTMAWEPMPARADVTRGTGYLERQLTERGIALLVDRVREAGLTEGCHRLRSNGSAGTVLVDASGVGGSVGTGADWSPNAGNAFGLARDLTVAEELVLAELIADLHDTGTWLPADAWVRVDEVLVRPSEWRILVGLAETGLGPGDVVRSPDGGELVGSDPRYVEVRLPGGVEPAQLGEPAGAFDGQTLRCAVVSRADAIRLAESIDQLGIGYHSSGPDGWMREEWGGGLLTTDLSQAVTFGIDPYGTFPGVPEATCADLSVPEPSVGPSPSPPLVSGDLADVDPCSLVPPDVEGLREADRLISGVSRLELNLPARECALRPGNYLGTPVGLTLYPRTLDWAAAHEIVGGVLGRSAAVEEVGRVVLWKNRCYTVTDECAAGVALLAEGRLLLLTAEPWVGRPTLEQLVDGLLERLAVSSPKT